MEKISNKKTKFIFLILIVMTITLIHQITYAAVDIGGYLNRNHVQPQNVDVKPLVGNAIGVALTVGAVVVAVMIVVIAIKYMISSPNEKAELKKYIIPYIVGAILVFASSGIVGFIINLVNESVNK